MTDRTLAEVMGEPGPARRYRAVLPGVLGHRELLDLCDRHADALVEARRIVLVEAKSAFFHGGKVYAARARRCEVCAASNAGVASRRLLDRAPAAEERHSSVGRWWP